MIKMEKNNNNFFKKRPRTSRCPKCNEGIMKRKIRKNYPFGKKSKPDIYCKDCGEVIKPHDKKKKRK